MPTTKNINDAKKHAVRDSKKQQQEILKRTVNDETINNLRYDKQTIREDKISEIDFKRAVNDELKKLRPYVNFGQLSKLYRSPNQEKILNLLTGEYYFIFEILLYYIDEVTGKINPMGFYQLNEAFDSMIYYFEKAGII